MTTPFSSLVPMRLYAFHLKLRPLQYGTLMPFNGELVHAAWLEWLRAASPEMAEWLHEGNKRRVFTCSSLQFPYLAARMREAERNNTHLPLKPEQTYTIRITLLLGELFPLFHQALMSSTGAMGTKKPPFMKIGKQLLLLEEVLVEQEEATGGWTGHTTFQQMVEQVRALRPARQIPLKMEFATLTTFSRGAAHHREYGNHFARLPLPIYVFPGLARRWEEHAPPELQSLVQLSAIEQYAQDEGIVIVNYDLKTHHVKFTTHDQPGFIGTCTYMLRGSDEPTSDETPLSIRQQILLLADYAFYCGVGYKTAMGMGQTRVIG